MENNKKVYGKGEGVPTSYDTKSSITKLQDREINNRISNLELNLNKRLSDKKRGILNFIAGINYTHEGITTDQLCEKFRYSRNYAQKMIQLLRNEKLIISTGKRIGHKMTYFLSNMQDYILLKDLLHVNYFKESLLEEQSSLEKDILIILLRELTRTSGVYHNFRLQTRLFDKRLYEMLDTTNTSADYSNSNNLVQWKLQSIKNKVKYCDLRLPRYRSATLQVSPNGMIEIYLGSSNNPYDLKNTLGLSELMADLGKIELIFHSELHSFSSIERFLEWKIVRMDFNIDINLPNGSYQTTGTNILKVHYLSHLYQFYTKQLPEDGLMLRIERMLSNPKPYPTILEFISP